MNLHLKRYSIVAQGAFGVFLLDGLPLCLTLERTYPNGPRGTQVVKIEPGEYKLVRSWYNRGQYNTWQVIGHEITAERRILVHKGNVETDSEGCILVGSGLAVMSAPGVSSSGEGFARLMSVTNGLDEMGLIVSNV